MNAHPIIKSYAKTIISLCLSLYLFIKKKLTPHTFKSKSVIKNILVLETALLGDVIAISPLLQSLAVHFPGASICMTTQKPYKSLLQYNPALSLFIVLESTSLLSQFKLIKKLRDMNFDLVISASPGARNAFLSLASTKSFASGYLTNRSLKTFYFQDHTIEAIGTEKKFVYKKEDHLTCRALMTLLPLGIIDRVKPEAPILYTDSILLNQEERLLGDAGYISQNKINLIVHPCASNPLRQWPYKKMILFLNTLSEYHNKRLNVTLIGTRKEIPFLEKISPNLTFTHHVLAGARLSKIMILIKSADFFIGSDSGPKFIADGFQLPLVELLGPQLPQTVGALSNNHQTIYNDVGCNPCPQQNCEHDGKCITSIDISQVMEAASKLEIGKVSSLKGTNEPTL